MQENDIKHLKRAELLELLIEQSKEVEELRRQVSLLQQQLEDRTIRMEKVGSIAEASLTLTDIFKAADEAASQYISNVARMEEETKAELDALRQKTEDECAVLREDTQEYCRRLRHESEHQCKVRQKRQRELENQLCAVLREDTEEYCRRLRQEFENQCKVRQKRQRDLELEFQEEIQIELGSEACHE